MNISRRVRIMIVVSIIWAIGAAIYNHNEDFKRAEDFVKFAYTVCTDNKELRHDPDLSSCDAERPRKFNSWMQGSNAGTAIMALLPIPFLWLAAIILLYFWRAQVIGFRAVLPWATLTRFKKLFVVFCALVSFASVLLGIVAVMNLYVDTKVPVSLSSFFDVFKIGDDIVTVEGAWTRTDLTDDTIISPLQTSTIQCNKSENRCTEALASVSGSVLMSEVVEYDIQSWTSDAIVFRKDLPCATEVFTIDLNTKTVSGAGHRSNNDDPLCKLNKDGRNNWMYQLSDGFKVYWDLHQKARPAMLRVIQSLFGN